MNFKYLKRSASNAFENRKLNFWSVYIVFLLEALKESIYVQIYCTHPYTVEFLYFINYEY